MALDKLIKVDGAGLSTTSDYRVGIITATKFIGPIEGSITATDANFTGNVTIGGTLTYEDVTNIDSVGIITARNNIHLEDYIFHKGDLSAYFGFVSDDTILFGTSSAQRFRINSSGQLITGGTATPYPTRSVTIQPVTGQTNTYLSIVAGNTSSTSGLTFGDTAGSAPGNYAGMFEYYHSDDSLRYSQNASEKLRIRSNGYVDITGASDLRLTLGSQGTAGTNDSNWIRGSSNNLMFNCANTSGEHIFEVGGTAKAKISPGVGVRAENTCKAWICYKHDGGVSAIHDDFYVTSVTDEATGTFSIQFDGDMGTEDAIAYQVGTHNQTPMAVGGVAYTPSYGSQNPWWSMEDDWVRIQLQLITASGNSYVDTEWWNLIAFGDAI